jgi:hypothetical protein
MDQALEIHHLTNISSPIGGDKEWVHEPPGITNERWNAFVHQKSNGIRKTTIHRSMVSLVSRPQRLAWSQLYQVCPPVRKGIGRQR